MICAGHLGHAATKQGDLHFGFISERPAHPELALAWYDELNRVLAERMAASGVPVGDVVIARGIDEMAERIGRGEVDVMAESLMPTLALERRTGLIEPTLLGWRKGQREYKTVFFTRRDSSIQRLEDLVGHSIVFEAPRSTSAYFVPRATLETSGLTLAEVDGASLQGPVVRFLFAGSELNQAYWVERRKADAGAFNDGDWARTSASLRASLRIFHTTQPVPRWLISFHRGLATGTRNAITNALLQMHETEEGRAALAQATGIQRFEHLSDEDQQRIDYWRDVLQKLGQ